MVCFVYHSRMASMTVGGGFVWWPCEANDDDSHDRELDSTIGCGGYRDRLVPIRYRKSHFERNTYANPWNAKGITFDFFNLVY